MVSGLAPLCGSKDIRILLPILSTGEDLILVKTNDFILKSPMEYCFDIPLLFFAHYAS